MAIAIYEKKIVVTEASIDILGHVNNREYLRWMEEVAIEHSAALGWPQERYMAAGLAGCTSAPASVTVQSAENTGITVTSQEKIKAEPDIAEITYSVYSQAADASTCQSENQTDLDAVLALLKEKGIADTSVQTSGLGLNPIYDWDNGKKITGYEMTTEVVVSDVAIEDAGAIISCFPL